MIEELIVLKKYTTKQYGGVPNLIIIIFTTAVSVFDEYIVHGEPGQKEKADAWQMAISLQDVHGLKVSAYLLDTARQHI